MFKRTLFLLLIPIFFSCSKKTVANEEKLSVLVTIPPYAYFVERIAGNTVEIQTLVPPGMNIHIYEPTPKLVESSSKARVWFRIDEPFEKKIVKLFNQQNPNIKIVNLQKGLDLLSENESVNLPPCKGHSHGEGRDLHSWLSPKFALQQSKIIFETLVELLPQNKELYQKNYHSLSLDLQSLDKELTKILTPFKGDAILTSHPALGYFCKDYGLIQLSVECEGKDPKPKDVEKILKMAKIYKIRSVFLQQGFNNQGATLIGKKLKLPLYYIDPYAKDYLKNLHQIAGYIVE